MKKITIKFAEFRIKNFKGIEDITFNLDKSPDAKIYALVGLNESGKTTILEAINFFHPNDKELSALEQPNAVIRDYNLLTPNTTIRTFLKIEKSRLS